MGLARGSLLPICFSLWTCAGVAQASPSLSEAQAANREARDAFERGDLTEAIKAWERAYAALPPDSGRKRAQVSAQLAATHKRLYDQDGRPEHLDRALELYKRTLDELGAEASEMRPQFQTAYDQLTEERKRLDERANSPEAPPAETGAEPSIHVPGEKVPLLDPYFVSTLPPRMAPEVDRKPWSTVRRLGVISLALAAPGLVGVGLSLGFGERADRQGEAVSNNPSPDSSRLQEIRVSGERANTAAIACGVTAGVFAVTGAVLLVVDSLRPAGRGRVAWRPVLGGLGLRF